MMVDDELAKPFTEINMEQAKFKIGQEVRTVNNSNRMVVTGMSECGGFRYTVECYGNQIFTYVAECDMIPYDE